MSLPAIRRRVILKAVTICFAAAPFARPLAASAAADAQITAPIQRLYQGLLDVMKAGKTEPFQSRFDTLAPSVDAALDLPVILSTSVGLQWSSLPPDQQQSLLEAFRRYTIATYVNNFDNFDGQKLEILPDLRSVGSQQVVQTRIVPASGSPHDLDYVMRQSGDGWKAVDVLADDTISRVAVQRSDFRSLLGRGGAPALLASLQKKTADLSDGAMR